MSLSDLNAEFNTACVKADVDSIDYWLERGAAAPDMTVLLRDSSQVAFDRVIANIPVSVEYFARNIVYLASVGSEDHLARFLDASPVGCTVSSGAMVNAVMTGGGSKLALLQAYGADICCAKVARAAAVHGNLDALKLQASTGVDFQGLLQTDSKFRAYLTHGDYDFMALFSGEVCTLRPFMANLVNDMEASKKLPSFFYCLENGASFWDLKPRNRIKLLLNRDVSFLDRLKTAGMDLSERSGLLLREAAIANNPILITSLIERGLDPHYRKGLSLLWALKHNSIHAAQTLVDHGVDFLSRGRELVDLSVKQEQWASVRWLFDKDCYSDRADLSKAPEDIQALHKSRMLQQRADQAKTALSSPSQHRGPSRTL